MPVVLALLLVAPGLVAHTPEVNAASATPWEVRESIIVEGDQDLTPENGVRHGSGTPEDPYVISNWLVTGGESRIRIENTTGHLLIQDVTLEQAHQTAGFGACLARARIGMSGDCVEAPAVLMRNVSHAHVRNVEVQAGPSRSGLIIINSQDVRVEDIWLTSLLTIAKSENIYIDRAAVLAPLGFLNLYDSHGVSIHHSTFAGPSTGMWNLWGSNENVTIAQTEFNVLHLILLGGRNVSLVGNTITGPVQWAEGRVFRDDFWYREATDRPFICGNTFTRHGGTALHMEKAERVAFVGNQVEGVNAGFVLGSATSVNVTGNVFIATASHAIQLGSVRPEVHGNNLIGVGGGHPHRLIVDAVNHKVGATFETYANATGNYWDARNGPNINGNGPGDGAYVKAPVGSPRDGPRIAYWPWHHEPIPAGPSVVNCEAELSAWVAWTNSLG